MLENLRSMQKPIYGISLIIGIGGILLSWVLVFISYSAIDNLGRALNEQVDSITNTLAKVEESAASAANEIDATNQSVADLETSLNDLDTALDNSGDAFIEFGNGLQLIDIEIGTAFISTGDDLKTSARSTGVVAAGLEGHQENLNDIKNKINDIASGIQNQRNKMAALKESIENLFSSAKISILLTVLLIDAAFIMLGLNAIADLMNSDKKED